jgi:two-component system cell cycle sensor histidine kinase PleC
MGESEALRLSEARFRDLVEGSIQGIIVHRHFKPLFANQAAADIFGLESPSGILNLASILTLYAPQERARITAYKDARMRGKDAPDYHEYQGIRADGTFIQLENRVSVVDWDGEPANLTTIFNITERKRAEQLLQESEERFRDFAESATDWFWEMGPDLRFTYFSRRFEEATGISPDLLLGKTRRELLEESNASPTVLAMWEDHLEEIEARRPFRDFRPPNFRDGKMGLYISISGKPIFGKSSNFKGYRGTGANVAEQLKAESSLREREAELRLHRDRAEEANRAKSEFLANVSHELRTPLNAILGFSDIMSQQLLGSADPEKYVGYAANIHDSATHLLRLITEILDISTVEAGKYDLEIEDIDFPALADACCRTMQAEAVAGKVHVTVDIKNQLPPLNADRRAVQNILLHLLANAIAFTPENGSVSIQAKADENWFNIAVEDTGTGISKEEMPKLTDPFEQGRRDPYRSEERTGLGLAVTLSMVKLHKGEMKMESDVGKGTKVTIRLPCASS